MIRFFALAFACEDMGDYYFWCHAICLETITFHGDLFYFLQLDFREDYLYPMVILTIEASDTVVPQRRVKARVGTFERLLEEYRRRD